jgi:hypothetical protein
MGQHHFIFNEARTLLKKHFGERLKEEFNGTHLSIYDTSFYISCNDNELTIGYGFPHTHYDPKYDSLSEAVDRMFNLLTKRIRITDYLKGDFSYKYQLEIELDDSHYEDAGTAGSLFFPFWRKTTIRETYMDSLIDAKEIAADIEELKNFAKHQYP